MITSAELINNFEMLKHPEGGYFKEVYRSTEIIPQHALPSRYAGERCFSTSIYFLLPGGAISRLHRLASDEVWHFYLGQPLELLQISPEGQGAKIYLGKDIVSGQKLQHVVPAGCWFGARPVEGSEFCFVGCTVAPGFDYADFELAHAEVLSGMFPMLKEEIRQFC
jgi:predicted cupin superfamily sugar epimerase